MSNTENIEELLGLVEDGEYELFCDELEELTTKAKEELLDAFVRDYYECACCGNPNEQETLNKQKEVKEFFKDKPNGMIADWMFGEDMEDVPELE